MKSFLLRLVFLFSLITTVILTEAWAFYSDVSILAGRYPIIGTYHAQLTRLSYLNVDPRITEAYNMLMAYKSKEAISYLKSEIPKMVKANVESELLSDAYTLLGYACFLQNRLEEALNYLSKAIDYNPKNYLPYYFRASVWFMRGDFKRTQEDLEKCVSIAPYFIPARRVLAQNYLDVREYDKAIKHYSQIVEILPNSGYFNYQLYKAYMKAHKYAEAEEVLLRLIDLEPKFKLNYVRLGKVLGLEGKYDEAEKVFKKFLDSDDNYMRFQALLGLAELAYNKKDYKQAWDYIIQAKKINPNDKELQIYELKLYEHFRKQRKALLAKVIVVVFLVTALIIFLTFIYIYNRKEVTLKYQREFDRAYEEFFSLQEACQFAVSFLSKVLGNTKVVLMLYRYQSGELYTAAYHGDIDETLKNAKIITSEDAKSYFLQHLADKRLVISVNSLERQPGFENVFPTLIERFKKNGLNYITPFFDRRTLKGIIGFHRKRMFFLERLLLNDELSVLLPRIAVTLESLTLYETSIIDETTGIYNKRYFKNWLSSELKRSIRYNQPCSVLVFDLDDFKRINDTFGHLQGDRTLKELANVTKSCIRDGIDILARIGGEEFALLLPATTTESAVKVAERIRGTIEKHKFPGLPDGYKVTVSIGVSTFPIHADNEEDLIKVADEALYKAKKLGKNRVEVAVRLPEEKEDAISIGRGRSLEEQLQLLDPKNTLPLYNYFILRLNQELKRARRYKIPVSLIAFRISNLMFTKSDKIRQEIIIQVAKKVKSAIRYGIDIPTYDRENDSFLILLPETKKENASIVARRLRRILAEIGSSYFSIVSFPEDATSSELFLKRAYQVLHYANDAVPIQYWQASWEMG